MKILAHQATIKTAAVEIRALIVSGKQVTLAVFRQLDDEDLIVWHEGEFVLAGIPWGRVNYHPDQCNATNHFHVVWQKEDQLLRSYILKNYS